MININDLRQLCNDTSIAMTNHAKNRLHERNITIDGLKNAIMTGEIFEQYEDDKPFPSCLLLGKNENGLSIHMVASIGDEFLYVITAYYPDEEEWESDLKTRKEQNK